MKNVYLILLFLVVTSCSSLNKTQVEAVQQFGVTAEEFTAYPGEIFDALAEVRLQRGLYYASTLRDPELHVAELDSIFQQKEYDYKMSQQIAVSFKILNKYARALVLLSSNEIQETTRLNAMNLGTNIDSLITLYNSEKPSKLLPAGLGNLGNQLIAAGSQTFIKNKQAKQIRKFIPQADTLIAVITDNLLEALQTSTIDDLIAHEERMISRDYLTYLQHTQQNTFDSQKGYLELKNSIKNIRDLQSMTIAATENLRKTHAVLLELIQERKSVLEFIDELQLFQQQVLAIQKTVKNLNF